MNSADTGMATVSFSVPDGVKDAFDEAFTCRDKSAVIADLMRRGSRTGQAQTVEPHGRRADPGAPPRTAGSIE